jgi:DNA polymerase
MEKFALDFESYYDKELRIKRYGALNYLAQTDTYLVAIAGSNFQWVGNPVEFDWDQLRDAEIWTHNFSFDGAYFLAHNLPLPGKTFNCSANLCGYLGAPRALANAAQVLLGKEISKDPRAAMQGRSWDSLGPEEKTALERYCLSDAQTCFELVSRYSDAWQEQEQKLSRHTIRMGWHGCRVDRAKLWHYLARLSEIQAKALREIPWAVEDGRSPLSLPQARAACLKAGIEPPRSFGQKDEDFLVWEAMYRHRIPFVAAVSRYRKASLLQRRLEGMERRILPSGRFSYAMRYFGAHTGRWSGEGGLNLQNMRKTDFHGVSARSLLIPELGRKLMVADLGQIEPRVLAWLCRDNELLSLIRVGFSFYEAQAKAWRLWDGPPRTLKRTDRQLYDAIKRLSLGAGYCMGARRFQSVVASEMGVHITPKEARRQLDDYQRRNPKVVRYWDRLGRKLQTSVGAGELAIQLPGGRALHYSSLVRRGREVCATLATEDGYRETRLWGGFLTENTVQAVARDVFAEAVLRLEAAGHRIVLHCHDEFVLEVEPDVALDDVLALIRIPPDWAADLPIDAEGWEGECYAQS